MLRGGEPALSDSGPEIGDRRLDAARAASARALAPAARPAPASPATTGPAAALSRRTPELQRRRTAGDVDARKLGLVDVAAGLRTTA